MLPLTAMDESNSTSFLNMKPPSNVEAERHILGSILRDNEVLFELEELQPEDFYHPTLKHLFGLMREMISAGIPIDLITISDALGPVKLEEIGGTAYLAELYDLAIAPVHIGYYQSLIRNNATLRNLIGTCRTTIENAYSPEIRASDLIANVEHDVYALGATGRTESLRTLSSMITDTIKELEHRYDQKSAVTGIPTGFYDLDKKINGLKPSDMIVVAGRPGMGKTSLVLNIAENIVRGENAYPVLVFSLEMSGEQLLYRMLSSSAKIDAQALQRGDFTRKEWVRLTEAAEEIRSVPIYVDDDPTLTIQKMLSKTRHLAMRLRREKEQSLGRPLGDKEQVLGAVVVDYLQLMSGNNPNSREREISEMSRGLKLMAKQLNVPVIALSQLNRSLESRADRRPVMSDLRESGAIEQDADLILFIYREDMYRNKNEDDQENDSVDQDPQFQEIPVAEIIIGKNRHGPTGTINLLFDGRYTRFSNPVQFEDQFDSAPTGLEPDDEM